MTLHNQNQDVMKEISPDSEKSLQGRSAGSVRSKVSDVVSVSNVKERLRVLV